MELNILEALPWLKGLDARSPAERGAEEGEAVVDEGPFGHLDGAGGLHAKSQEVRGDGLEVVRVGEEREHLGAGAANDLGSLEDVAAGHRGKSF
jgi:hypothetical protein